MLELRNLRKSFNGQEILKGLSLECSKEQITVIIGGSGQGKTVLLKHLIGLLQPDEGQILIDGEDMCRMEKTEARKERMRFGLLFQDAALFDSMNVYQNISFPLREHTDLSEQEMSRIVEKKLDDIRLPNIQDKMPSELSGGMRKRVGLARATVMNPEIMLYDEPTTGLDPVTAKVIDDLMVDTQRLLAGTTVIISHDIPSTLRIANHIAMLHDGRIVAEGTPEEFVKNPSEIVQNFLGPVLKNYKTWGRQP